MSAGLYPHEGSREESSVDFSASDGKFMFQTRLLLFSSTEEKKKHNLKVGNYALLRGFPGGSDGKVSICSAGDLGSIPGLGRSPGEGNDNPFQYSCLENSMD